MFWNRTFHQLPMIMQRLLHLEIHLTAILKYTCGLWWSHWTLSPENWKCLLTETLIPSSSHWSHSKWPQPDPIAGQCPLCDVYKQSTWMWPSTMLQRELSVLTEIGYVMRAAVVRQVCAKRQTLELCPSLRCIYSHDNDNSVKLISEWSECVKSIQHGKPQKW